MRGLSVRFALAPLGFFFHYRHPGPVHLHIQDRNRLADNEGQIELDCLLNLLLLVLSDIDADSLCRTFHRFGCDLQISQQLHLLPSLIEGRLLADHRLHTAHSGRELCILDVQFNIGGELPVMTMRAQIVGTEYLHLAYRR